MAPIALGPVTQTGRTVLSRPTLGRLLTAAVLTAVLLALLAGAAAAQPYPPGNIVVVTPGAQITITGNDWGPGTTVEVEYLDDNGATAVSTARVAADGTFAAQLAVPPDAALGDAQVTVRGTGEDGQPREDNPRVFVQSAPADGGSADGASAGTSSADGGSASGASGNGGSADGASGNGGSADGGSADAGGSDDVALGGGESAASGDAASAAGLEPASAASPSGSPTVTALALVLFVAGALALTIARRRQRSR